MATAPNEPITARPGPPPVVDLATWQAATDELLVREKARTREGNALAGRPPPAAADGGRVFLAGQARAHVDAARRRWSAAISR